MGVLVACALGLAIGLTLLWLGARAAITVAVLRVEDGKLVVARGGVSARVLSDLRDVVARPRVPRATLRIVRAGQRARIEVRGPVDEHQRQRLRNVVGTVPLAQLVKATRR